MADTLNIDVAAGPRAVDHVLTRFAAFADAHRLPSNLRREVHLALDEIVANVVHHGCSGKKSCRVGVTMALAPGRLTIDVSDNGRAFDPLARADPLVEGTLEQRPIGGLGIYLTKELMDRIEYRRQRGRNHLVIEKAFDSGSSPRVSGPGDARVSRARTRRS